MRFMVDSIIDNILTWLCLISVLTNLTRRSEALKPLSRSDNFYDPDKDEYNLEQAIADKTQENTIAYSGLAYMTGGSCEDSFIPPGKVADYFSFQYLRDNTDNGMGHNTDFLTNCANNVLAIFTDEQVGKLAHFQN